MQIKRTRNIRKKVIAIILALTLLGVGGYTLLAYLRNYWPFAKDTSIYTQPAVNYDQPSAQQTDAGKKSKDEFLDKQTEASQQQAAATGQTQTPAAETVALQIPTRNLSSSSTTISSIIDVIDSSGMCTLTMTKVGASTISATATTQTMGSYSTCKDFKMILSNVPKGEWQASLEYKGSAGQSGRATKVITLE